MILHEKVKELIDKALDVLDCEDNDCCKCSFTKICANLCELARNLELYIKSIEDKKHGLH